MTKIFPEFHPVSDLLQNGFLSYKSLDLYILLTVWFRTLSTPHMACEHNNFCFDYLKKESVVVSLVLRFVYHVIDDYVVFLKNLH